MLYVTTRNNQNVYTAQKILLENRGPEGGFFIPFRHPSFSIEEIAALAEKSFGQCVADVLNILFDTKLTSWDIDFCIGRYPVRLNKLNKRILVGEVWHNPDWSYEHLVHNLTAQLCGRNAIPGDWLKIAIRIAVLFGIYGQLLRQGIPTADISVVSGDFSAPISAWYARKWGLPIGNIVCACNENKSIWDLICYGQIRTDTISIPTFIPEADISVPDGLERLIYDCVGLAEVRHYREACHAGKAYMISDPVLGKLRNGLVASVISSHRIPETISGVHSTHSYLMTQATALSYAALMDYRAKSGETRPAIVWSEKSPVCEADTIANILEMPTEVLLQKLHQ